MVNKYSTEFSPLSDAIIEQLSKTSSWNTGFTPQLPDIASDITAMPVIPIKEAEDSKQFTSNGLGVFTCEANKHIWKLQKDASGEYFLVRDEELSAQEDLIQDLLENS